MKDDEKLLNDEEKEEEDNNNKKSPLKYIIIVILAIIIIGLTIFLVYYFILREDKDKEGKKEKDKCESGYYLINNTCEPYSFMATYHIDNKDENIDLINVRYYPYIERMYMNNK